ncbi:MAG: hypothetical protein H7Z13_14575 [Ferruginibacter sp.]|nr:hypothetical protein [Ferruginibacter sp.]
MKKITTGSLILSLCVLVCVLFINACSKKNETPADPCAGKTIVITATTVNAATGASNGSLTATATGSTGFTYSINNGAFQASGVFPGLAAGAYNITAKDADNCTATKSFTISSIDICLAKNITVNGTAAASDKCSATGSITITAAGSTGFTYSLNNGAFQSSNVFNTLVANSYTLNVKDVDGCVKTSNATVSEMPAGVKFAPVKTILQTNCTFAGCHGGASPQSGINFTIDCTIVSLWDRIKARAVDASPSVMPPAPNAALSASDKQKITDWITAGHKYTD